jgi:hypothetical protein
MTTTEQKILSDYKTKLIRRRMSLRDSAWSRHTFFTERQTDDFFTYMAWCDDAMERAYDCDTFSHAMDDLFDAEDNLDKCALVLNSVE